MTIEEREIRWAFDLVEQRKEFSSLWVETRAETNAPAGTTLFVASTDTEDRAMDVVKQNWKLASFRANPVILDNHMSMRVVGQAVEVSVPKAGDDAGKLMIRVEWDQDSPDPTIRNVGHQHLRGIRRAGSVGFRAGKRTLRNKLPKDSPYFKEPTKIETPWGDYEHNGYLFESPELLEFSSATIPMNAEALQRSFALDRRAEGDEPPAADPDTAEADVVWEWLSSTDNQVKLLDLVWPGLLDRAKSALFPEPEPDKDVPADEPIADKAWRRLWLPKAASFLRTDTARRIVQAYAQVGPPTPSPLARLARMIQETKR